MPMSSSGLKNQAGSANSGSDEGESAADTTARDKRILLNLPSHSTPDIYIPHLLRIFEQSLSPAKMALLNKSVDDLKEHKITQEQVIRRMRLIVGEDLMVSAVKSYKVYKASKAKRSSSTARQASLDDAN